MKITSGRKGISQSMDLFIIISAVLGVGGVVSASVYGLIGSSAAQSALMLTQVSLVGTGATTNAGGSATLSLTVKNIGSSSITVPTTAYVTLSTNSLAFTTAASTNECPGQGANNPSVSTSAGSAGGTWAWTYLTSAQTTVACTTSTAGTSAQVKWFPAQSFSLPPGAQLTFSATISVIAVAGLSNPITTGNNYALTVNVGTTTISQQLTSQ